MSRMMSVWPRCEYANIYLYFDGGRSLTALWVAVVGFKFVFVVCIGCCCCCCCCCWRWCCCSAGYIFVGICSCFFLRSEISLGGVVFFCFFVWVLLTFRNIKNREFGQVFGVLGFCFFERICKLFGFFNF